MIPADVYRQALKGDRESQLRVTLESLALHVLCIVDWLPSDKATMKQASKDLANAALALANEGQKHEHLH